MTPKRLFDFAKIWLIIVTYIAGGLLALAAFSGVAFIVCDFFGLGFVGVLLGMSIALLLGATASAAWSISE